MAPIMWTLLTVIVYFFTSALSSCTPSKPIENDCFEISCKYAAPVTIKCKKLRSWAKFPWDEKQHLEKSNVTFHGCDFPRDLDLLNVTKSLGLGHVQYLEFQNSRSAVSRENIKGFRVFSLEFTHGSEVSDDLLHDIVVEQLFLYSPKGWTTIPKDFFKNSANLMYLVISGGSLRKIRRNDFEGLKNLQSLLLHQNQIDDIEAGSVDNLVSLELLEVGFNRLTTLPAGLLRNLVNLTILDAYQNKLTHLPAGLLQIEGNKVFNSIRLNDNSLLTLPDVFFKHLNQLTGINLKNNSIKSLPPDVFYNATALKILDLSVNSLVTLPQEIFYNLKSLEMLHLNNNSLVTLPPHLFENNTHLKFLNLRCNVLETLPDKIFESVTRAESEIRLDYNRLTNLSDGVFFGMEKLRLLNISHNQLNSVGSICYNKTKPGPDKSDDKNIEVIDLSFNNLSFERSTSKSLTPDPNNGIRNSIFEGCIKTKKLYLKNNKVSELFLDWDRILLKYLNLENNTFTHLGIHNLMTLKPDMYLNLRSNKITTVDFKDVETVIDQLINYHGLSQHVKLNATVDLEDNPFDCDCKLISFVNYLKKKFDDRVYIHLHIPDKKLKCMSPPEFENVPLKELNIEHLRCSYKINVTDDACNGLCSCYDYPEKKTLLADCSYRSLSSIPSFISTPNNYSIQLNMSGNHLSEAPQLKQTNSYFRKVTSLDLSSNKITLVPLETFSESLRDLKLHDNSISRFEPEVFEYLLKDKLLRHLTLHRNRWICDCKFFDIIKKKPSISHSIMCHNKAKLLSDLRHNDLCFESVAVVVGVSLLVAFFGVVVGGLAALYYKYQKEIKVWLYSKQWCLWFVTEDELDKDKLYDAFISFSHKDEEFVEKEIVAKLEEGPKPYKLCLHYRDWLAGEWIPAQIARSVEESRRTIIILSPNFIESIWGRMEFRTAHNQALNEGRARVIVILYGDVGNFEDFDAELKAYLSMNTYVKWGDPWFWDKLRYALPHRHDPSRRRTRNARILENHLEHLPINYSNNKAEIITVPKISNSFNDSAKLLDPCDPNDNNTVSC